MFRRILLSAALSAGSFFTVHGAFAKDVKVAYIPCGQVNDGSWSEAGYDGVKNAAAILTKAGYNVKIDYSESLSPAQAEVAGRDYAHRGYQTVVFHCGTFADAAYSAGKDFPSTHFLIAVAPKSTSNVWSYTPAMQDISFVSGYLAAKMSKNAAVGVVGSFDFSNIVWQSEGFRLGARYANPNIQTFSNYIDSFDDADKAREAAQAEIDSGADVIYSSTDQASRGIYAATASAGDLAMASYSDQSSLAPTTVLTSALADIPLLVSNMVVGSVENTLVPEKTYAVGMAGGIGALVFNPKLTATIPPDVMTQVNQIIADIKDGKLKIPAISTPGGYAKVDMASLKTP